MRNDHLERSAKTIRAKKRTHKRWMRVVSTLAAITVFCTTYALILPAITMSTTAYCGLEEHEHSEACYERQLVCGFDENGNAVTPQEGEPATEIVTESVLVDAGHIHDESCYNVETTLICENTEEDHEHTEACYEEVKTLVCGEEEREAVYEEREVEVPVEAPDAQAAPAVEAPVSEGTHEHTDACYEEVLICEKEEHKHTDECFANSEADLETAEIWERTLPEKSAMKDEWKEDTLLVAQSQVGYKESEANYVVVNEEHKGYTRYGEMFGVPYGDWCAMFLQFSLHYAGVDTRAMVGSPSVPLWVEAEIENENFYKVGDKIKDEETGEEKEYQPKATDIIFFDWENDGSPDHVGIIEEIKMDEKDDTKIDSIITIEGNSQNEVRRNTYKSNYEHIYGYSEIPDKMTEEELQGMIEGREKAAEEKAKAIEKAGSIEFELKQAELEATIYTDETYSQIADKDETKIIVKGELPFARFVEEKKASENDKSAEQELDAQETSAQETEAQEAEGQVEEAGTDDSIESVAKGSEPELAVEVKAYPVEAEAPNGAKMILSYDIKILYKDEYKTIDTGDEFQPIVPVNVSFESPLLAQADDDTRYSVYHTPESGEPELVAEQSRKAHVVDNIDDVEIPETKTIELTEEEQALVDSVASVEELEQAIIAKFEREENYVTLVEGCVELISQDIAFAIEAKDIADRIEVPEDATVTEVIEAVREEVFQLIVQKDDNKGKLTFEASHFSPYTVIIRNNYVAQTKSPRREGLYGVAAEKSNANDRSDEASVTSVKVTESGTDPSVHQAYKLQTLSLTLSATKAVGKRLFQEDDYFTVALPEEFDYNGLLGKKIPLTGAGGLKGTGQVYINEDDGKPYLDVIITSPGTNANVAVFGFAASVPFNFDKIAPNAQKTITASSGAGYASDTITIGNYSTSHNSNITSGAEVTSIGMFGMNFAFDTMQYERLERGDKNTIYALRVNFNWTANANTPYLKPGDYIDIQLPKKSNSSGGVDGLYYADPLSGPVDVYSNDIVVAQATYDDSNNTLRIQFNENVGTRGDTISASGYLPVNIVFKTTGTKKLTASTVGSSVTKSTNVIIGEQNVVAGSWQTAQYPYYYEISNYTDSSASEITTFLLYPAGKEPNWNTARANLPWNSYAEDGYVPAYCADSSRYYKVTTLNRYHISQAPGLTDAQKKKLKGIIQNGYPYVDAATMLTRLGLSNLITGTAHDEDVVMTAMQFAIWNTTNAKVPGTFKLISNTVARGISDPNYVLKGRNRITSGTRTADIVTVYNALINQADTLAEMDNTITVDNDPVYVDKSKTRIISQMAINSDGDQEYWIEFTLNRALRENENPDEFVLSASSSNAAKYINRETIFENSDTFRWVDASGNPTTSERKTFRMKVVVPVDETKMTFTGKVNGAVVETITPYFYYNGTSQSVISGEPEKIFGNHEFDDEIPIVPDVELGENTKVVVEKNWFDADGNKLTNVPTGTTAVVQLYQNGEKYGDAVTLDGVVDSGTNNGRETAPWKATWTNLPYIVNGVTYSYEVKEESNNGYYAEYLNPEIANETSNTKEWQFVRRSLSEIISSNLQGLGNTSTLIFAPGQNQGFLCVTPTGYFYWSRQAGISDEEILARSINDSSKDAFWNVSSQDNGQTIELLSQNDYFVADYYGRPYLIDGSVLSTVMKFIPTSNNEARMLKAERVLINDSGHTYFGTGYVSGPYSEDGSGSNLRELSVVPTIANATNFYFYMWDYDYSQDSYLLLGINNRAVGTTEAEVEKKWQDASGNPISAPNDVTSLTVKLLQNGQEVDTINGVTGTQILNAGNSWKYKWDNLPVYDENGNKYTYQIIEVEPEGYELVDIYVNKIKTKIGDGSSSSGDGGPGTGSTGSAQGTVGPITNTTNTVLQAAQTDPDISRSISFTSSDYINYSEHTGNQVQIISNQGALAYDGSSITWQTRKTAQSNNSYDDVRKQLWKVVYSGNQTGSSEYNGYYYNLQNVYDPNVYLNYNSSEYFTVGSSDDLGYFGSSSSYKNRLIGYVNGWRYWNYGNISGVNRDYFTRYKSNGGNITYHKINSNLTTGSHPYVPGASDSVTFGLSGTDHTTDTYGRVLFDAVGDVATITQNVSSSNSQYTVTYNISGDAGVISVAQDGTVTALADGDATVVATVNTGNTTQSKTYAFRVSLPADEPEPEEEGPADGSDAADDEYVSKYQYKFTNRKSTRLYEVEFKKVASEDHSLVDTAGENAVPAVFDLYIKDKETGEWMIGREIKIVLGKSIVLNDLEAGTDYKLVEIQAPTGRKLLESPVEFKIVVAPGGASYVTWRGEKITLIGPETSDIIGTIAIPNDKDEQGVELPHTGGIGTVIFTALGAVLVIGAAIALLATRKRRD